MGFIILGILLFWAGFLFGFVVRSWLFARLRESSAGTIVVSRNSLTEKTVYSLVLDDYPEKLEFKKLVIFKVEDTRE